MVEVFGTHWEMGNGYGQVLKESLVETLEILKQYFIDQHQIPYDEMAAHADAFFSRYSNDYQQFIHGMAKGSGLSLDDCKILNGMETLPELLTEKSELPACAFLAVPPPLTQQNSTIIGRNYDFPQPFDLIAKNLTVTVLHANHAVTSAIISMPGQIYCPSCINAHGVFIELNNGMPSGGSWVNRDRESLLIRLLKVSQTASDLNQADSQLQAIESDYSLIINVADKKNTRSYEFSSTMGMKSVIPNLNSPFVSTNFYLHPEWTDIPTPTDENTWVGVTRRKNLLSLAKIDKQTDALHSVESVMKIMDQDMENGGGRWDFTIYQMVFDTSTCRLFLKVNMDTQQWVEIPLKKLLNPA